MLVGPYSDVSSQLIASDLRMRLRFSEEASGKHGSLIRCVQEHMFELVTASRTKYICW